MSQTTSTAPAMSSSPTSPPSLASLALEAVIAGFSTTPPRGPLPRWAALELARRLPEAVDVTQTAGAVDEELYWRRVAAWQAAEAAPKAGVVASRAAVAGAAAPPPLPALVAGERAAAGRGGWREVALRRAVETALETFGTAPASSVDGSGEQDAAAVATADYDAGFCRPAIDSAHPSWGTVHPHTRGGSHRAADGRPATERVAAPSPLDASPLLAVRACARARAWKSRLCSSVMAWHEVNRHCARGRVGAIHVALDHCPRHTAACRCSLATAAGQRSRRSRRLHAGRWHHLPRCHRRLQRVAAATPQRRLSLCRPRPTPPSPQRHVSPTPPQPCKLSLTSVVRSAAPRAR